MLSSNANPDRAANTADSIHAASGQSRLPGNIDHQHDPAGKGSPTTRPLRRQELEGSLQTNPADLSACVELASIYRHDDRPADAVRVLRKASEFHPDNADFLWAYEEALLARSLQQLRKINALAARLTTVEVEQEKERCEANWARCRIDACRARLQRNPNDQHLRLTLAQALKELEQFDEAIQETDAAAQDHHYAPTAHLIRAQCLEAMGERAKALRAYRAAALRRSHPAPARIRLIALRAAVEIAETLGLDLSAQQYRRFLQLTEAELTSEHESDLDASQGSRHSGFLAWHAADEEYVAEYEAATLKTREELSRLFAGYRQARRQERTALVRKAEARCSAIRELYSRRQLQVLEQERRHYRQLDEAMATVDQAIEEVRAAVLRRLESLPGVDRLAKANSRPTPSSVREAEEAICVAGEQIHDTARKLHVSAAAKLADTAWILLSTCGLFVVIWAAIAFAIGGLPLWIALASGVLVVLFLFLSILPTLQIPLRRQTHQIYPHAERLYFAAKRAQEVGKSIAAATAVEKAADLVKQRATRLRAAERWKEEKLNAVEQAIAKKEAAKREELERELEAIRQRFKTEADRVDKMMLEKSDGVDAFRSGPADPESAP